MERREDNLTRREWISSLARKGALAAIGAVAAVFLLRRQMMAAGETCPNRGVCAGCGAFDECGLPAALSAKRELGKPG